MNLTKRILIVDDDADVQDAVSKILRKEGYYPKSASDTQQAIEIGKLFKPHIYLIDIKMPGDDGFKLLQQLNLKETHVQVIIMSACGEKEDVRTAFSLGAIGFLTKPFGNKELIEEIDKAINIIGDLELQATYQKRLEEEVNNRTVEISKALEIAEYQGRQIDLLLNSMSEPLIAIDFDLKIMLLNAASEKYLKLDPCTCLGSNFSEFINNDNLNATILSIIQKFKTSEEIDTTPPVITKIEDRIYSVSINILKNMIDKPAGCVLIFNDQTVSYRSSQLRSGFLSLVAHEFRTPLTALLNSLSILQGNQVEEIAYKDVLEIISMATNRFSRLISSLLTFAAVQSQDAKPHMASFDINSLINHIREYFKDAIEKKGTILSCTINSRFEKIITDEHLLKSSLECLVDNAIKFSPRNSSVKIDVSTPILKQQTHLLISVKDSGPGIPESKFHSMFEWFAQGEPDLTRSYSGMGIGLPLALRAIEILKGKLDYQRLETGGSNFILTIPILCYNEGGNCNCPSF